MYPFLHFHLFSQNIKLPTFGLLLWVALMVSGYLLDRAFRRAGIDADAIGMVAVAAVTGLVGAKLWHVLDTPIDFQQLGWAALWDPGGLAWYGGLTFGLIALLLQGKFAKVGMLRTLDLAAPAAAIGYGIGRLGCLFSGDGCYGVPTTLPWGMAFPHGIIPTDPGIRVHPTPLYEFILGALIGLWLWKRSAKQRGNGAIVGEYLLLSGIARFVVEFVRHNPKVVIGLSNAQLASVGSAVAGVLLIVFASKQKQEETPTESAEL